MTDDEIAGRPFDRLRDRGALRDLGALSDRGGLRDLDLPATGRLLKRAQWRNHRAMDRALAGIGSTLAQWDALRSISEAPDSSAHDLAIATFQSDQAFGTLAHRLEAQGLIVRTSGKGRRVEHSLTPDGERILEAGLELAQDVTARAFAKLTPAEAGQLHDLLERVGEVPE